MTPWDGDDLEMPDPEHPLSVDDVDRLIDGQLVLGNEGPVRSLASQIDDLRLTYRTTAEGLPVDQLAARAMTEARLIRSDKGDPAATPASNANRPAPQVSGLPKTRRKPVLETILAFLATTAGKAAVAAALVGTAATGGLIATDNFPLPGDDDTAAITTTDVDDESADIDDVDGDDADDPDPCEGLTGVAEAQCEADQECAEAQAEVATEDDDDQTEAQLEADQECAEAQAEVAEAEREAAEEAAEQGDDESDDDEIDEVESDDDEVEVDEVDEVEVDEVESDEIESDDDEIDEVESDDDEVEIDEVESDDDEVESDEVESDEIDEVEVESDDDESDGVDEVESDESDDD